MKLWKNKVLSRVYFSSKGYFTFRFGSLEEKDAIFRLNTVQMGGRTLYLKPWMEGSKFRKNILDKVSCWIRLVDVPHSYWSREVLSAIAGTVGPPLKFDEITRKFEPLKFSRVQVELTYSAPNRGHPVCLSLLLTVMEKKRIIRCISNIHNCRTLVAFVKLLGVLFLGVSTIRTGLSPNRAKRSI